jgi:hypothetical protein
VCTEAVAVVRAVGADFFLALNTFFSLHEDPIYLQAVIIHSANGGKG